MTRQLSPRRLLCLLSVLSSPFSTVNSCSLSQLHQAATASGLNALLLSLRCHTANTSSLNSITYRPPILDHAPVKSFEIP